ncbi:hypothetical protein LguiB_018246 [Lonicera macranthoides]
MRFVHGRSEGKVTFRSSVGTTTIKFLRQEEGEESLNRLIVRWWSTKSSPFSLRSSLGFLESNPFQDHLLLSHLQFPLSINSKAYVLFQGYPFF